MKSLAYSLEVEVRNGEDVVYVETIVDYNVIGSEGEYEKYACGDYEIEILDINIDTRYYEKTQSITTLLADEYILEVVKEKDLIDYSLIESEIEKELTKENNW